MTEPSCCPSCHRPNAYLTAPDGKSTAVRTTDERGCCWSTGGRACLLATIAMLTQRLAAPPSEPCLKPPRGWWCSRGYGHAGPCAARQTSDR